MKYARRRMRPTITRLLTIPLPPAVPLTAAVVGTDRCYTVKVGVRDSLNTDRVEAKDEADDDVITLKIRVRDRDEPPSVPTVTVTSPTDNTTLVVTWHARKHRVPPLATTMTCSTGRAAGCGPMTIV